MIEYVTKNEETDELELKPISYGIPEITSKEDPTALDYEAAIGPVTWNLNTEWTAPARGVVYYYGDIINYQYIISYKKKDGSYQAILQARMAGNIMFGMYPATILVKPGDTFRLSGNGGGGFGEGGSILTFVPFKVQYD